MEISTCPSEFSSCEKKAEPVSGKLDGVRGYLPRPRTSIPPGLAAPPATRGTRPRVPCRSTNGSWTWSPGQTRTIHVRVAYVRRLRKSSWAKPIRAVLCRLDTLMWPCSPAGLDMVSPAPLEPRLEELRIHFYTPRCASSRYAYGLGYTH